MVTILTTTGNSLFTNTRRTQHIENPTDDQMRQFLRIDPKKASAEANSLLQMAEKDDQLVLLHTQTPMVVLCTKLLHDYFLAEGYKTVRMVELQFDNDPKHIETTGFRKLIEVIINEILAAKDKEQEVIINATSGFKALVVYSTMLGMIYQVPVKYIYEDFQNVVTFKPIAVDWDTSLFLSYESFFKWLDSGSRTPKQVEQYLQDFPDYERIETLLTTLEEENCVLLSDMGEMLRRKYGYEKKEAERIDWPPSAGIANPEDKIAQSIYDQKHHPSQGALNACLRIAQLDYVRLITASFYENTTRTYIRAQADRSIILHWAGKNKTDRFIIYTTAESKPQVLKVVQHIKEILGIE